MRETTSVVGMTTQVRRAVLVGYYGLQNTGDDALLAVAAWGAQRYLGCDEIFATAGAVPATYGIPVHPLYARTTAFPLPSRLLYLQNFIREYLFLARPSSIIFGGGSNFHSTAYLESRLALVKRTPGPIRRSACPWDPSVMLGRKRHAQSC